MSIDYIDIRGTAASASLTIDYLTQQFIDFFNLLKIDGRWQIVSKIFYRIPKP
ncbi:nuclear transport factor 2 family protein [Xylophilus sp. GOD-11R]|uniref:nuclear transport factor 2 family protein n=1 Tax=Xylophilus sp. GOD-11R TaxID=3089814 RepID=UPI00298CE85E|nr:nuclear transport factor 2 family protein [Xylophilus sp. GOD-11R]WPB58167.1 nuclear transport factor 2 family protein [Xylophilus sp. GOD-11R]